MAGGIAKAVADIAKAVIEDMNMELVDVEFVKEGQERFLRIYIYKKDGVGIDDCVAVHHKLDKMIDDNVEINGSYTMEVSSPGYDRAFGKADFHRYMDQEIQIKLYKPFNGQKLYEGKLIAFENDTITIDSDGNIIDFELKDTAKVSRLFKI